MLSIILVFYLLNLHVFPRGKTVIYEKQLKLKVAFEIPKFLLDQPQIKLCHPNTVALPAIVYTIWSATPVLSRSHGI